MSLLDTLLSPETVDTITGIDTKAFLAIHQGTANDFFDVIMPVLRNKLTWVPLYLFFAFFAIRKYKIGGLIVIGLAAGTVLIADQFAASLMKPAFERLRPCNEPNLVDQIRNIVTCGSGYSFISAHATNHFALAVFFSHFFNQIKQAKWIFWIFMFWASAVSFAQVYVGVHYPLDVTIGALSGIIIGYLITRLTNIWLRSGSKS